MNWLAEFVVERKSLAWILACMIAISAAVLTREATRSLLEGERLVYLQTETDRAAIELMSHTLNGSLMGAMAVQGIVDEVVKRDVRGEGNINTPALFSHLESIGLAYRAEGVFLVGKDGVVRSSWDSSGKPSSGLNVKFRPYFKMAMQGRENVYAAVSLARGDRALYFTAPVYADTSKDSATIGAVVGRTALTQVDDLLRSKSDIALLLSPQGVVFASSRAEWVGYLAGSADPERLKAIRELKQFGNMFDKKVPPPLPLEIAPGTHSFEGKRFAAASARVQWNDPSGDWQLVVMEDLSRTVSPWELVRVALLAAVFVLLIGFMLLKMLRGHYQQTVSTRELASYAGEQEASAQRKVRLASAALDMQQAKALPVLAQTFLGEAHAILGALQGVVYVSDKSGIMHLAGSYACSEPPPEKLVPGDGLLGQCAADGVRQILEATHDGVFSIRSGLGETNPVAVMMAPVQLGETRLGVAEIALLRKPDAAALEQFEELCRLLAMNIEIIGRNMQTEEMLSAATAAEHANAEQLAFQQTLVDTIPYPVFTKDADARFVSFNRAYEIAFAVRREDLLGKRVLDLEYLPETDRIAYQTEDEAAIASAGSVRREAKIPFADGVLHDTMYFVSGFRRPDGSPGGLVGTFIDVTALKNAEREMERFADLERFNRLAQNREQRILELKREINTLCLRLSESARYTSAEMDAIASIADQGKSQHLPYGETGATGFNLVKLVWHPAYECGQPDIDRDHRLLFDIANDLLNAIISGKTFAEISSIIEGLVNEVTHHFSSEEALLFSHGYPHANEHAVIHRNLMEKAVALIGEFRQGRVEAGPFFEYLAHEVIARHMLGEDRKFFPLFQTGKNLKQAPVSREIAALGLATRPVQGLGDLVDLDRLQKLFSAFCETIGIPAAIIDLQGNVLASSRWQRACTDFHRANPESCARCIESDTDLALKLNEGQDFAMYRCRNGMIDCAAPIIVEGLHLANVFIGQFHLAPPDTGFFSAQAQRFGYDEADYLKAISEAPLLDERRLPVILRFLAEFAQMISSISLARNRADAAQQAMQRQADILQRERVTAMSLAEDAERSNRLMQGREERILELKQEVNALAEASGQTAPYAVTLVETVGDHETGIHPDYRTETVATNLPRLDNLVDIAELQTLFSAFCESVGIAAAVIDLDGKVLVSARWQRACTDFHRVSPESCARCIESDTELAIKLQDGQDFTVYTCRNGMTDAASPIIVEGQHLANVFIGQFHLGQPDLEFFRAQAREFSYPEEDYLQAVREAPIIVETRLPVILGFLAGFARTISTMSLARLRADAAQEILKRQAELLRRERVAALSLAEDADRARRALANMAQGADSDGEKRESKA